MWILNLNFDVIDDTIVSEEWRCTFDPCDWLIPNLYEGIPLTYNMTGLNLFVWIGINIGDWLHHTGQNGIRDRNWH